MEPSPIIIPLLPNVNLNWQEENGIRRYREADAENLTVVEEQASTLIATKRQRGTSAVPVTLDQIRCDQSTCDQILKKPVPPVCMVQPSTSNLENRQATLSGHQYDCFLDVVCTLQSWGPK